MEIGDYVNCIITKQPTKTLFKNKPLSKEGRLKLYEAVAEVKKRTIVANGLSHLPTHIANSMLRFPITNRAILQCYVAGKDPFEVFGVTDEEKVSDRGFSESDEVTESVSEGA